MAAAAAVAAVLHALLFSSLAVSSYQHLRRNVGPYTLPYHTALDHSFTDCSL